jgi:hypothetical protein
MGLPLSRFVFAPLRLCVSFFFGKHFTHAKAQRGNALLVVEQRPDVFHRTTEHGALATFDDGSLQEFRMRDEERDDLVVREFAPLRIQFSIDGLFRAQQIASRRLHLGDQFAQFRFAERRGDVVDSLEFDAALTEQAVCLAAGASSRLFVDGDGVVAHFRLSNFKGRCRARSSLRQRARRRGCTRRCACPCGICRRWHRRARRPCAWSVRARR